MDSPSYNVTKEQHLRELTSRATPVINVNIIIAREGRYLIGSRSQDYYRRRDPAASLFERRELTWLFPGGRMRYNETPQETAGRILRTETSGVNARLRKLIAVQSDKGWDSRAYGVSIYYLLEYMDGEPTPNEHFGSFKWMGRDEFLKGSNVYQVDRQLARELDVAIRSMNVSHDEPLVEVDENDNPIGDITKREAHVDPSRYHRAAHIMIFDTKGRVVLQQRAWSKSSSPGRWDMPGGHQASGQTVEQCAVAELSEEMGITTDLTLKRKGLKQTESQSEYYYLYYGVSDGPYGFDRNEVETIATFDCQDLLGGRYDKDYDIIPHVKAYAEELRSVWERLAGHAQP